LEQRSLPILNKHLAEKVGDVQGQKQIHHYFILIILSMRYRRTFSNSSIEDSPKKVGQSCTKPSNIDYMNLMVFNIWIVPIFVQVI